MTKGIPRSNVVALTNVYLRRADVSLSEDTSFIAAVRGKQAIHDLLRFNAAWTDAQRHEANGIGICRCGRNCFGRVPRNADGTFVWGRVTCRCIRENNGVRPHSIDLPTLPTATRRSRSASVAHHAQRPMPPRETGPGEFWDRRLWMAPSPQERAVRTRRPNAPSKRFASTIRGVGLRLNGRWHFRGHPIGTASAAKQIQVPVADLVEWYKAVWGYLPRDCSVD